MTVRDGIRVTVGALEFEQKAASFPVGGRPFSSASVVGRDPRLNFAFKLFLGTLGCELEGVALRTFCVCRRNRRRSGRRRRSQVRSPGLFSPTGETPGLKCSVKVIRPALLAFGLLSFAPSRMTQRTPPLCLWALFAALGVVLGLALAVPARSQAPVAARETEGVVRGESSPERPVITIGLVDTFKPDTFLILSSGDAVRFDALGLEEIATRRVAGSANVDRTIGAVFVVPANSPIRALEDLKGRSVATTSPAAFEGWLVPMNEIARAGFDPEHFFSEALFTEWNVPDAATMVLSGQTEVAILSTCALEEAVAAGAIDPQALRVVHEQPPVSAGACKRSTELFPDMMLASLPNAHPDVVRDVTVAVLTAPPDRRGYDWVSNNNRQRVLELMERLQLGPWAYLRDMSPSALVERYKLPLAALAAALLVLAVHVVRVNLLVRRRTRELMRESRRREAAAEALRASRQALANLERAGMVAQLSAMFAHELKQPLTAIVNYLTGIKMLRAQGTFDPVREAFPIDRSLEAAYLAADIVERVRRSAKRQMPVPERANLCSILSCAMQHAGALKSSVAIERRQPDTPVWVDVDALEIELVLVNLIKNALEAVERTNPRGGRLEVSLRADGDRALVTVEDNGEALPDEIFCNLGKPHSSTKKEGLGLGLAVATSIAEAHRGHLAFERRHPQGLRVTLTLPMTVPDEASARPTENLKTDHV